MSWSILEGSEHFHSTNVAIEAKITGKISFNSIFCSLTNVLHSASFLDGPARNFVFWWWCDAWMNHKNRECHSLCSYLATNSIPIVNNKVKYNLISTLALLVHRKIISWFRTMLPRIMSVPTIGKKLFNWRREFFLVILRIESAMLDQTRLDWIKSELKVRLVRRC